MFSGSMVALATPFSENSIDEQAFAEFAAWQLAEGSEVLVPCTATGEAPTLTDPERKRLIEIAVDVAAGRVPVLAGIAANCTRRAIDGVRVARWAGADGALVVTPAYSKPTQEGLYRHVEAIARAVDLPLIVQNAPNRTGVDLTFETVQRLARLESVVGFVEGSGELTRRFIASLSARNRLSLLTSSDAESVPFSMAGGSGTLSIVANVAPRLCASLHQACRAGEWSRAAEMQRRLYPLTRALELETDPAPLKYALFLIHGHLSPELRLPLVQVSCTTARMIAAALEGLRAEISYE